jgi:hypothetical protein
MSGREEYKGYTEQFVEDMNRVSAPLTDFIEALDFAMNELATMKEAAEADLENEQASDG